MASPIAPWRPGMLFCVLACVAVGLLWGWSELALAVAASAGVILHRRRVVSLAAVLLLLASAAAVATLIGFLDERAAFRPYGLEDFVPLANMQFLLDRIAPLAGAMAVLALSVRIGGLPVRESLVVAYGAALATAVMAFIAGSFVAIGGGLMMGGQLGVIMSRLTDGVSLAGEPVLYAAPALPLLVWIGVRLRGSWPVLCAIAATLLAMRL